MADSTLRQIKDRIAGLSTDDKLIMCARYQAAGRAESFDESDWYDLLLSGMKGLNDMTDDEVQSEFDGLFGDMDPPDLHELIVEYLDN